MKDKLQLQQYLNIHPMLTKGKKSKIAYVSLVNYICTNTLKMNQWEKKMISLYKRELLNRDDLVEVKINSKGNLVYKFEDKDFYNNKRLGMTFKFALLTDCLFIGAFGNEENGKRIFNKFNELFPKNKINSCVWYDWFYHPDMEKINDIFPSMEGVYKVIISNREHMKKRQKRIMITANMSAGKSTLVNALVGKKINKTKNDTCTSKIHCIYNKEGEDGYIYKLDYDLDLDANDEVLMEDNAKNNLSEVLVSTKFRSLCIINDRMCYIDTPGVNSSQNKEHRELTSKIISEDMCDLLIYLLNGENIGTEDELSHIRFVFEKYHGEVLFLINKLDRFKEGEDSVSDTLRKVKEDLMNIGYKNPKVYPISAYAAYLAKMALYNEFLNEDELDELEFRKRKLRRGEFMYYKYFDNIPIYLDEKSELEILLKNSGILSLEKVIY